MNKKLLWVFLLLLKCSVSVSQEGRIFVKPGKSTISWKGTKLNYTSKHEGTVGLISGFMVFKDQKPTGGEFKINMNDIRITDIPPSDPIPIRNLTAHLKSDFETATYPFSSLKITRVTSSPNGTFQMEGLLTIKGIEKTLAFPARKVRADRYEADLRIDRRQWKIGEQASWLEKKLVDPEIELHVIIGL